MARLPGTHNSAAFELIKDLPSLRVSAAVRPMRPPRCGFLLVPIRRRLPSSLLAEIGAQLGSDVTAALASKPARMTGQRRDGDGEVSGLPVCGVLLANPGVPNFDRAGRL